MPDSHIATRALYRDSTPISVPVNANRFTKSNQQLATDRNAKNSHMSFSKPVLSYFQQATTLKWRRTDVAMWCLQLAQLLHAGVAIDDALDELASMEQRHAHRSALNSLGQAVTGGKGLSEAISQCNGLLTADHLAVVQAGEASGNLAGALEQIADGLQWQNSVMERARTVLAYPLFAALVLLAVCVFVLVYLVPTIEPLLVSMNADISIGTQVLFAASNIVNSMSAAYVLAIGIGAIVIAVLVRLHHPSWRLAQSLLLQGPVGRIRVRLMLARYANSVGMLYESGIPVTEAMAIAEGVVSSKALARQLAQARTQVLAGSRIGDAMQRQTLLPSLFVRMLMAGESAGVLDVALKQLAFQLQLNVKHQLDRTERLIGPVLISIMGTLLLWLAVSLLGPVYGSISVTGAI